MNVSKKPTKEFEKGWTELSLKYREWEDMKAKGKMKMKKKINKDGKEYYDFDFSRYQYYYSYPEDHIGLATPSTQRQFIDYVIDKSTENFSGLYLDSEANTWPQLENILKPLQLHEFLSDMGSELSEKITDLRIEKSLRIKKMKGLFGSQNQLQKSTIQFIEAQIRSLMHKQIRISSKYHKMGLSLNERLQDHKSYLKTRTIDQLQFSQLTKGDIAVLMRIRQTKQNMAFNCQVIQKIIEEYYDKEKDKIEAVVKQKAAQRTYKQKKQAETERSKISSNLIDKINEMQPTHFDNPENKQKLQALIESLDYFMQFQTSVQKTNPSAPLFSQHFTAMELNFTEPLYISRTNSEIKERFMKNIEYYFIEKMIDSEIMNGSYEHICYKINNLCFLQLKVLWESYNYAHKKEESSLIKIRSMMRKQLELVFSEQAKTLLNIRNHSIKVHGTELWVPNLLHGYEVTKFEGEAEMEMQMKQKDRFKDPTLCSFLELLGVNRDVVVREQVQAYAQKCNKNSKNIYRYRSLYYRNCAADEKTHFINVLNHSISLNKQTEDSLYTLYYSLMAKVPEEEVINVNFLNSYYMLLFLRCSQTQYQLMEVLNAQLMCMIKVQSRLKLLWQRASIPFEMSRQFVDRFIDPNDSGANGWNFATPEANDGHAQSIFKDMYNQDAGRDYIEWNAEIGIQVRRRKSDNPLLQGKSVLYPQTPGLLSKALARVQYLCSLEISRRQCFLPAAELTQIVDRLQLLLQYLSLQHEFQKSKLRLLDVYHEELLSANSASCIRLVYEEMSTTMQRNNIADITQPHLAQNYQQVTRENITKYEILKNLYKKQHSFELAQSQNHLSNFQRANTISLLPELSSMYYVQEITVQQKSIIEEELDDDDPNDSILQSEGGESVPQNASSVIQGGRNTFSEVSSMLESGSQYHIKMSFQEVLSKNQVKAISDSNNKKEEIMNKKKSKIINDSILGSHIPRTMGMREKEQFYSFSQFVVHIMHTIDRLLSQFSLLYPKNQSKLMFLQSLLTIIEAYTFEEYRGLILPQELPVCLNLGHKALNKFVEKARAQCGLSSRSSNDHWLCLGSKVIENIISNETNSDVDEMRGLYLCLNAAHINQIDFKMKQFERIENSQHSQYKLLQNTIKCYSTGKIDSKECQLQGFNYFERRNLCFFKLFSQLKESGEVCQLVAGNYMQYFKAISSYDFAVRNLIVAFNKMFQLQLQQLQTLQTEIKMMQKYQCCSRMFEVLSCIPGLENRVWLRKKLDFISSYEKTIITKQSVAQLGEILQVCCQQMPKFRKVDAKMSLQSTANIVAEFQQYITEIQKSAILINMFAEQITSQLRTHHELHNIHRLCWMMPSIQKHMHISILPNLSALNVFNEHRDHIEANIKQHGKDIKLKIAMDKISVKRVMDYGLAAGDGLASWIRQQFWIRSKSELYGDDSKIEFKKSLKRHFPGNLNRVQSQIQVKLQQNLKDYKKYTSLLCLRQWLQTHQLMFGCGLSQSELIKFRKMLMNPSVIFPIFWEDNTKHIVSNRELSKLKSGSLDAEELIQKYRRQYLTYIHLKKVYKHFIDDLAQFQFDQQAPDIFLILYLGAKQYFKPDSQDWTFLERYCDSFLQNPKSQVDQFCKFAQNLSITLPTQKRRLESFEPIKKYYNLSELKYWIWRQNSKQKNLRRASESKRFLKQVIIDAKSTALKPITDEVALPFYKNEKLSQMLQFLQIDIADYKEAIQQFSRNIDKHVLQGMVKLSTQQLYIFNLSEKNMDSRIQLLQAKQQVVKIISTNKFYEKLIREKFYGFCNNLLDSELSLRRVLAEDLFNEEASRQHRILKQTTNKILVPKVKLNPFLSSPLKTENYFFSGTIKMSYIDQFLNKLRNRAVLIELAEGGTGYLLKVNELDESVDVLCKAIIGFSQKEFADRFRTIFEAIEETKQRNQKLSQENNNLKQIIKAVKGYESKEIKSLLYEKLNDYMIIFYEQSKNYEIMVNLLKSVENKIEFSLNQKFSDRITSLQKQNSDLKTVMDKIRKDQNNVIKSFTTQVRDTLYEGFKSKAESILDKNFLQQIEESQKYEKLEAQDAQVLIKKLKMQKSFYELKIAKIEGIYNERIKNLQKKLTEQSKLQNLLLMEQQKNKSLARQVKQLQKCSIQNQLLKKQMNKKQQQQTMQKFRLVKINESLKGKLKRVQDENELEKHQLTTKIQGLSKIQQKSKSSFSVQVSSQDTGTKAKRKSFHIKTEISSNSQFFDVGLWKEKWLKSQKRLQQTVDIIRKAYEHFIFTKNSGKLIEVLKSLLSGFEYRKIESSFSTQK